MRNGFLIEQACVLTLAGLAMTLAASPATAALPVPARLGAPVLAADRVGPLIYALGEFDDTLYGFSEHRGHAAVVTVKGILAAGDVFVDSLRQVYVSSGASVLQLSATGKLLTTFDDTGHNADGVALCPNGTLFVANSEGNTISIYAKGSTKPTGTLVDSGTQVFHLACDAGNNLFVTVAGKPGQVDEFPATGSPVNLPIHLDFPEGIAIDRAGDVVVPNGPSIAFYHIGDSKPFKTVHVDSTVLDVSFEANDQRVWATTSSGLERFSVKSGRYIDGIAGDLGFIAASPRD
jgi:hypothetical protein